MSRELGSRLSKMGYIFWSVIFLNSMASELTLLPENPSLKVSEKIFFSVSGGSKNVEWLVAKGLIEGAGSTVSYTAPDYPAHEKIMVLDKQELTQASLEFTVLPDYAPERATWYGYNNRDFINALAYHATTDQLWVATQGGLELRAASTGRIEAVFTEKDGLPSLMIYALVLDHQHSLWVATADGLARKNAEGVWQEFTTNNSLLPDNHVFSLHMDEQARLWVGTAAGVARFSLEDPEVGFIPVRELPGKRVRRIASHVRGGRYVLFANGELYGSDPNAIAWSLFPLDYRITDIALDGQGRLWFAFWDEAEQEGGFGLWNAQARDSEFEYAHGMADISALFVDQQDNLWLADRSGYGVTYFAADTENFTEFYAEKDLVPIDYATTITQDKYGAIWVGTGDSGAGWQAYGLLRRDADGHWERMTEQQLPNNHVLDIVDDEEGGLWIATGRDAVRKTQDGEWELLEPYAGEFIQVESLHRDDKGGLWLATHGYGLFYRDESGNFARFTTQNSNLPGDFTRLYVDQDRNIWVTTRMSGFAKMLENGEFEVFNRDNSPIPVNHDIVLADDGQGGLWVGTGHWEKSDAQLRRERDSSGNLVILEGQGLIHRNARGEWGQRIHMGNSPLPHNDITALRDDGNGGVWIGTHDGLAHYQADGQWEIIRVTNPDLPGNRVSALFADDFGGLWVGTDRWYETDAKGEALHDDQGRPILVSRPGLAYLNAQRQWNILDRNTSGLPDNDGINKIHPDGQGGLWIGTKSGGLTHLEFGNLARLVAQSGDKTLAYQRRAAIIVAAGGNHHGNQLWDATEATSNLTYRMFHQRGFSHEEIYYVSSKDWADFNGDGQNDQIVDAPNPSAPLKVNDLQEAFNWAEKQGVLDQPLYVFFMDHGGREQLQLAHLTFLRAEMLASLLDNYQGATGNAVILNIEACHAGSLLAPLAAPNRAIIASADADRKAVFQDKNTGFTPYLVKNLLQGRNFADSFRAARTRHEQKLARDHALNQYAPQGPEFDDNGDGQFTEQDGQWLSQVYINGRFVTADQTLAVEPLQESRTSDARQPVTLRAKAGTVSGRVTEVWGMVSPPKTARVMDANDTPVIAYPRVDLTPTEHAEIWQGTWSDTAYDGVYEVTFYVKDDQGYIAMSEDTTRIQVSGGAIAPENASLGVTTDQPRYVPGETLGAEVVEHLGYGYDLYVAMVLPNGDYLAFQDERNYRLNQPVTWEAKRNQAQSIRFSLPLGVNAMPGSYCAWAILVPARQNIFENWPLSVTDYQCVQVNHP